MKITRRSFSLLAGATLASLTMPGATLPALASGTMDDIKARGSLRVGVTQAPPWYSKDPATGEWTSGVGVSAGKAMAEALGVEFEPVEVTWGTAVAALQSNKIDIMFVLDATEERKQAAAFPDSPLLYYSLAVLAKDELEVSTWEDLNKAGVKISVPQATSMDKFLTENVANADIQRFPGNTEAIAAFQSGRVDAVCLFHPPLIAARQKLGSGKIVVPSPVKSNPTSAAVRQGDADFVAFVDTQLQDYYQSGKIQAWYEEFLTGFGLDPKAAPPIIKELL
ncbi:transporter substrate-binding domain-containing protein [Nitratireductor mangrovi]|uniref:Transporter substrate-binding domain-containing protein n=1 Tax=Nitratireductor mangrovi TaxID=2599600 RepID=A0A5B8KTM3_9HYPH|nr:transporter substrate-binding domain-containing protein [Nitratireductor mangrovi]QDY98932.1 transporter substrate-binding domain-containing protein [Nitratireductor mangrovi]